MDEHDNAPLVYQLRIWLQGVSPMVWRRLVARSDESAKKWGSWHTTARESSQHSRLFPCGCSQDLPWFFPDSFLGNHVTRHRVVKQRIIEELERHAKRWGFEELRQWHDRGLQHPVERLEDYPGSHGSWPITLDYDLNADAAGRPLVLLGDLVAAAIRRDLEGATGTNASPPIVCIERRMFPVLTGLGKLSDAEQRKARAALEPLWAAWGVRFSNEANVQK